MLDRERHHPADVLHQLELTRVRATLLDLVDRNDPDHLVAAHAVKRRHPQRADAELFEPLRQPVDAGFILEARDDDRPPTRSRRPPRSEALTHTQTIDQLREAGAKRRRGHLTHQPLPAIHKQNRATDGGKLTLDPAGTRLEHAGERLAARDPLDHGAVAPERLVFIVSAVLEALAGSDVEGVAADAGDPVTVALAHRHDGRKPALGMAFTHLILDLTTLAALSDVFAKRVERAAITGG